jgi:hypothetical protein
MDARPSSTAFSRAWRASQEYTGLDHLGFEIRRVLGELIGESQHFRMQLVGISSR